MSADRGPVVRQRQRVHAGPTLVELLVVIAVLGGLAVIIIANLTPVATHASNVRCATDLESIQSASSAYRSDHGAYAAAGGGAGVLVDSAIVPSYLHTWPTEKQWTIDANGTVQQSCP